MFSPGRTGNSKGFSLIAVLAGLSLFAATVLMLGQGFNYVVRTRRTAQLKNSPTDIESALMMGIAQRVKAHATSCTSSCSTVFLITFNDGTHNTLPGIGVFSALENPAPSVPNSSADPGIYSFQVRLQGNSENHTLADRSVIEVMVRIVDGSKDQSSQLNDSGTLVNYKTSPDSFYYLMVYRWTLSKAGKEVFVQTGSKKVVP